MNSNNILLALPKQGRSGYNSRMRILYIGDIMARPGREVVKKLLPELRLKHKVDLVIAQAENVSHGKGMTPAHMHELMAAGVDCFTGGNHTIERPTTLPLLKDPNIPVLAPLNQPGVESEWGVKVVHTSKGSVQVISVLGTTFPDVLGEIRNPLEALAEVLQKTKDQTFAARIVNFHGDFSSEKRVIGYFADGHVSAVIGDHWHVPTADAMILPKGTAHITDVGMCGTLHSSLGVVTENIVQRWRYGVKNKNDIAEGGPYQFNAVLVTTLKNGLAKSIRPIAHVVKTL